MTARSILAASTKSLLLGCGFLLLSGCDDSELRPWHTEILEQEFVAADSERVVTFDDYRDVEDTLFRELDERIYAHTPGGPDQLLERYSPGSLADPRTRRPDWNRSFELPGDGRSGGVLLLHGMSDSPYSLRALGETLQQQGLHVLGLRMPGHGTIPSGLLEVHWQDMAAAVTIGMRHLARELPGGEIAIIGYSTGAALALDYSLKAGLDDSLPTPSRLALISPAIGVSPAAALAKWSRRLSLLPGLDGLAWLEIQPEFDPYKYNSFSTNAAEQVYELTRSVAQRIRDIDSSKRALPPILVVKSTVDATVSNDAVVDRLLLRLSPGRHELLVFDLNRFAANTTLLKKDPGPFTERLVRDSQLPFGLTLVTNTRASSQSVSGYYKPPFTEMVAAIESLQQRWPTGVFSLSHVALPFPPDDPLYGEEPPPGRDEIFLGQQALQGERGVLRIPGDFLLRLRYNPFYGYMQERILRWLLAANQGQSSTPATNPAARPSIAPSR